MAAADDAIGFIKRNYTQIHYRLIKTTANGVLSDQEKAEAMRMSETLHILAEIYDDLNEFLMLKNNLEISYEPLSGNKVKVSIKGQSGNEISFAISREDFDEMTVIG